MPGKSILIVSYYYTPIENPGTRRVGAFTRYLPQYGYHPVVLTTSSYGMSDGDLSTISERLIFRAPDILDIGRWIARLLTRTTPAIPGERLPPILTPDSRLARVMEQTLIPDIHIGWLPGAVLRGRMLLRAGAFRAIFSSSPPPSTHLVALALKRLSGLPWVADFRDGWTFEPPNTAVFSSSARLNIERILERMVVLSADRIVTINQVLANDLRSRFPTASERITVISNGYDPEDFNNIPRLPGSNTFEIVYTGRLAGSRQTGSEHGRLLTPLLQALQRFQNRSRPHTTSWRLTFAGALNREERALLENSGLGEHIRCLGNVSHRLALQLQAQASILLLITAPDTTSVTTSKLYEYLASGRPILALTGRSAAAALIEEFDAGLIVAPDDVEGICRALEQFYDRWRAGALPERVDPRIRRFDRRRLTGELATIFDELGSSIEKQGRPI